MFKILIELHYLNDVVSSLIGIMANLVVMYIVRRRTSKEMRQYSQTLMQNCTVDLLMNIVILITKEQYETYDGLFILMLTGFSAHVSHPWDILLHMSYLFIVVFCLVSMVIPYYCRNDMLSDYRVFTLYFYASIIILSWSVLYCFCFLPDADTIKATDVLLKNSIFVKDDGTIPINVSTKFTNWVFLLTLAIQGVLMSIAYGLIIYFGKKIHKTLNEKREKFSKNTYKFHYEINRVLFIQAIVPVLIGSITVPLVVLFAFFQVKYSGFLLIDNMTLSWICVVNPIFAIFMVTHYRKAFFNPGKYLFSVKVETIGSRSVYSITS